MIILLCIYVIVATMTYCLLTAGQDKGNSFNIKRFLFSLSWPYFATIAYLKMLQGRG